MVKRGKKHIRKTPARQASQATQSEPNKIGASTPYDFDGKNLTPYGGLVGDNAGETRLSAVAGVDDHEQTSDASDEPVRVLLGTGPRLLRGVSAAESNAFHCARFHIDRDIGSRSTAAAIHIVALSGGFAPERGRADSQDSAGISATCLGSRERETGDRDAGHRHDRAHGLWKADGCTQELQPKE